MSMISKHIPTTRENRQRILSNPITISLNIPHLSVSSVRRIKKIPRQDLLKSSKIPVSTTPQHPNTPTRPIIHKSLSESTKTQMNTIKNNRSYPSSSKVLPWRQPSKIGQNSLHSLSSAPNFLDKRNQTKDSRRKAYPNNQICCPCTRTYFYLLPFILILLGAAIAAILLALIKIPPTRTETTSITTNATTSISIILVTTSTATETTSTVMGMTTTTTTTANCVAPYVRTPSQTCVNTMIDFNNCGTVGHVCPANYRSCSAGVCSTAPAVQLDNPNSIWSSPINGAVDDAMYNVNLPINITLYNTTKDRITVTTNGVLCLASCAATYTETALPTTAFSGATVLPFWDDLYIYANTSQGIYYGIEGNIPNRTLIFEYYLSHFSQPTQYYHFQIIFFEAAPGIVQIKYFDASDGGISCTVGVQGSSSGPSIQHSFHQANSVQPNMTLTFNTTLGSVIG